MSESLRYWEREAPVYTSYADIEFEYQPNAQNPDIVVRVVETISRCGDHETPEQITGCAPLIPEERRVFDTQVIRVIGELEGRYLRNTIKHELGHVLGLHHDEEPQEVMSYDPSLRIPNYEEKKQILNQYQAGVEQYRNSEQKYNEGTEYYDADQFTTAAEIFYTAAGWAREARSSFQSVGDIARDISQTTVRQFCEEAREKCYYAEQSYANIAKASEEYGNRNWESGDYYINQHQDAHNRIGEFRIREPFVVREEIGFSS